MPSETERLAQQLLIGLTSGAVIALVALGYTMVYGIIGLINFAHGDLYMLGSFAALTLAGLLLAPSGGSLLALFLLLFAAAAFCALLNVSIERAVYRPLRGAPKISLLVSAIGVSFVLQNLGLFWGALDLKAAFGEGALDVFGGGKAPAAPKHFPDILPDHPVLAITPHVRVTVEHLLIFGVTAFLLLGLDLLVRRTRIGAAMRAVSQDPVAARLMGIDTDRVILWTFAAGGALAGCSAVLGAVYTNSVHFQMGYPRGLEAFTAAVLGGIGSLPGAVLGGLLIGVARALCTLYAGEQWSGAAVFGILVLILVFRPSGLFGEGQREKV